MLIINTVALIFTVLILHCKGKGIVVFVPKHEAYGGMEVKIHAV
jgi:hypothetical protein